MDNDSLREKLNLLDEELLSDLQSELDNEICKSRRKIDTDKISELSNVINDIEDCQYSDEEIEIQKKLLFERLEKDKRNHWKYSIKRKMSVITACAVLIVGLNTLSIKALGVNAFTEIYQLTKGGITFLLDKSLDNRDRSDSDEDVEIPFGMKESCAEYGINTLIPTYIPDGFELTKKIEKSNALKFSFSNDDKLININYIFDVDKGNFFIPSDEHNVEILGVNGIQFTVSTEDNQYRAVTINDDFIFLFTSYDLDYNEAERIICSLT